MKKSLIIITLLIFVSLTGYSQGVEGPGVIVLGMAQDGGYPHPGCEKECCNFAWENPEARRMVVSLALIDPPSGKWFLFEATPDLKEQLKLFREITNEEYNYLPDAVFISHAHIGHYNGLMEFGREVMNTSGVPVYVLPRMKQFLESNGPWSQLVDLKNIVVTSVPAGGEVTISENITIKFFTVPHRDEFSETAGFSIITPAKKYLFIPDIDKWEKWEESITERVRNSDFAFLDGTFFNINELPGRDMNEIPHPFVVETIALFKGEPSKSGNTIQFVHLNHSNPLLRDSSNSVLIEAGMSIAQQGKYY